MSPVPLIQNLNVTVNVFPPIDRDAAHQLAHAIGVELGIRLREELPRWRRQLEALGGEGESLLGDVNVTLNLRQST